MKTILIFIWLFSYAISVFSQNKNLIDHQKFVLEKYGDDFKNYYDKKKNILEKDGVIHIFLNDEGNLVKTGIPTTATQKNTYKIHLITDTSTLSKEKFVLSVKGTYKVSLNIDTLSGNNSILSNDKNTVAELVFATVGPFTDEFSFTITRNLIDNPEDKPPSVVKNSTVTIAKIYHVSIATGLFISSLEDPTNIREVDANGGTTLIADDTGLRGIVVLNAVFYPKGRSFLLEPSNKFFSPEKFGILVGTRLDKNQFENFLTGFQFDFARGGSLAFGAHYGRRNTIFGHKNFDFGNDIFEGTIDTDIIRAWDIGFFMGLNIDLRVAKQFFKPM